MNIHEFRQTLKNDLKCIQLIVIMNRLFNNYTHNFEPEKQDLLALI